jgi:hypothetical protein
LLRTKVNVLGRHIETGRVRVLIIISVSRYLFIHVSLEPMALISPTPALTANLKLGLALHHLPVLPVQPDNLGVPRPLVDVLEKGGDGVLFALSLALDLAQSLTIHPSLSGVVL